MVSTFDFGPRGPWFEPRPGSLVVRRSEVNPIQCNQNILYCSPEIGDDGDARYHPNVYHQIQRLRGCTQSPHIDAIELLNRYDIATIKTVYYADVEK